MPRTPVVAPRSLAELNRAIRACVDARARGDEPAEDYEQLLVEWSEAIQRDVRPAA
ncbi:hypothetical protein [Streptomyces sp. NBC_00932]|uniref:hypothetical protein n=1 Tax=Streptomyces sp. NBC_00932 TaxID=2903690 RepID=UPI0038656CDB|nr:hypothetical protein OG221_27945 [Streptomyces sp. NBC_00932]